MKRLLPFCALASLAVSIPLRGADWPRWRGPGGLGVSSEERLPLKWSATENVLWKVGIAGKGASSPVIVGERIYLTAQDEEEGLHVLAIHRKDGKTIWRKKIGSGNQKAHQLHNMATPSPVADGSGVWVLYGTGDIAHLDPAGKVVWQRNVQKEHAPYTIQWGMGTSPVLHEGKVFLTCMQVGPSYLLALDAKTGKDVWKEERDHGAEGEARDAYSTPILVEEEGRTQLVVCGGDHIDAYDPATGKRLWVSSGLQVKHPYGRSIASPTAGEDLIVAVASGFRGEGKLLALRPGGEGDITESHRLWTYEENSPDCPTPVCYRGLVFFITDNGIASCVAARNGELQWRERLFRDANVKVSPVAGAGRVYFTSGDGTTKVVDASATFKVLAENELGEYTVSTPALSDGKVYLRTEGHLWAIGE